MRFLFPLLLIASLTACEPAPPEVELETTVADTVLTNGKIYTVNTARPWVEAVAIKGGKYIYTGDAAGVQAYIGVETQRVDLQGKMAMPGINDVHAHPWQGGFKMLYECNFSFTATPGEIAEIIKDCIRDNPDAAWIRGGQWTSDFFQTYGMASPRLWLDELSADKAMYFEDDATHNAWVNSKALELAGIDRDTADPAGGTIVRDENGVPNGVLLEPYQVDAQMPEAIRGTPLVSQDTLVADLISLDKNGFTVKIHTAGDGAVRLALDAIEQVRETNGDSGLRHELAHAGFIHADDLPRFAALDVTVDLSPAIWYPRPIFDSIAGAVGERAWHSLEAMVTRRNPFDNSEQALWPEQAISLAQAIEIFTLGGAKAYRLEDVTGSVEIGKSAELVVLNQNLFEVPEEAIGDTEVVMTLFEGRVVYE